MPSPTRIDIAMAQMEVSADIARNAVRIADVIARHRERDLIVFPEYALSGPASEFAHTRATIADTLARHMRTIAAQARACAVSVLVPSLLLYRGAWYSAATWFERDGSVIARHRKSVLTSAERAFCTCGVAPSVAEFRGNVYGIALCAEGNGSEAFADLSMRGAKVIIHPAFPDSCVKPWPESRVDPWQVDIACLFPLRARIRALIDQVYVASVVPANVDDNLVSRCISPHGEQIARARSSAPETVEVTLDLSDYPFRESASFKERRAWFARARRRRARPSKA